MKIGKTILAGGIMIAVAAFFYLDLQHYLSLDMLKSQKQQILQSVSLHPYLTALAYFFIYIIATGLSLPGATILTLAGGMIFGLLWGTLLVSFASTIGATLAFLIARYLLRDWVEARFGKRMASINDGLKKDGAFYLLSLRLIPVFPFFMINLVMGITEIPLWTYYWVSQLGMLPATLVYVNAGTQLAEIQSLSDIASPGLLLSLVLVGLFPLIAKFGLFKLTHYRLYSRFSKPESFDNNLLVIGAGSGGLVTAYIAAAVKAKVTLVEKHKMGGDCLNTGCVPSKALIRSAKFLAQNKRSQEFGIRHATLEYDFADIMQRVHQVIKQIEPHDSVTRYRNLGVNVIQGEARIKTPWEVEIITPKGVKTVTTKNIVIATGAQPFVPPIPGIEQVKRLTSDTLWHLTELPKTLLVLGGGPIGCELSQSFQRLGSQVIQVEMASRLLIREDEDVSEQVLKRFMQEGIDVRLSHIAKAFKLEQGRQIMLAEHQGKTVEIVFDQVLVAIGRKANVTGFGLDNLEIQLSPRETIQTNLFQQTNYPNIYAVGDVAGPYQFTHTAAHQAWYAAVNALFGQFWKFKTDYSVIPWSTFIDPEVARVGLNEQDARQQNIAYEITRYDISDLDRAIADNSAEGFIKVLTPPGKDKILGVTIVGEHAGDLLAEFVLAMKHGLGLNAILSTIHIYPTLAEANKYVAGNWKRQHVSSRILHWLQTYHRWMRKS